MHRTFPFIAAFGATAILTASAQAAPITDWVRLAGNTAFSGTTATTSSPVTTDADADTIAANFAEVNLADGQSIILTGSVSIDVALTAANQFRIGLFDGDTVTLDDGTGYVGYYAGNPGSNAANLGRIGYGDGTGTIPFSSSAFTEYGILPDQPSQPAADATIDFELTLTRDGSLIDLFASFDDGGTFTPSITLNDQAAPSFTFNKVSFLLGGNIDGSSAAFSDIDVSVIPEPASLVLMGLGGLMMLGRSRR